MSAGTRSSAMTATAPASSAIFACSAVTTSMMTPPLSISAIPRLTRVVPATGSDWESTTGDLTGAGWGASARDGTCGESRGKDGSIVVRAARTPATRFSSRDALDAEHLGDPRPRSSCPRRELLLFDDAVVSHSTVHHAVPLVGESSCGVLELTQGVL